MENINLSLDIRQDIRTVFKDKRVFSLEYLPESIIYRDKEIRAISPYFISALRGDPLYHTWVFGASGIGKTLCMKSLGASFNDKALKMGINAKYIRISCRNQDVYSVRPTATKVLRNLAMNLSYNISEIKRNWGSDMYVEYIINCLCKRKLKIILVLDDIHLLSVKDINTLLGIFSRIHDLDIEDTRDIDIGVIAVTNKPFLPDELTRDVKSTFGRRIINFLPYNAVQLQDILSERALAGYKPDTCGCGVVAKCAAVGAQEDGDARTAITYLRVAGEIADENNKNKITEEDVDIAEDLIEVEQVTEVLRAQPRHTKILMAGIFAAQKKNKDEYSKINTTVVFKYYELICLRLGYKSLTQRRVSTIISELDELGIVCATTISKGRYGKTREIVPTFSGKAKEKINLQFLQDIGISDQEMDQLSIQI
ncbi:MAG: hypothetical protein DRH37_04080 [Deltaproteobacteria bacterium]|nr:MAG: hypothetical protein DRH37_04080 [Deltaproteobacteria bacterium]